MPEHQGSKRVGPPLRQRRGFMLLPLGWFIIAGVVTLLEFGAMAYEMATRQPTAMFLGHGDGGSF